MGRLTSIVSPILFSSFLLTALAQGQATASNAVGSSITAVTPAKPAPQPAPDAVDISLDPASLLPDLPPLKPAKASLIGGTVRKLDRVRDQITVQVFGGGKIRIAFDTRTHVYDNGTKASLSALRQGDRVYVDTVLDGSTVFARSIRLKNSGVAGESQGTVTSYRADKGELEIRDALSPNVLKIRVTPQTKVIQGDHAASAGELVPGTLVSVKFGPADKGHDIAQELTVLAVPGSSFTFAGRVTSLDLRLGLLVLESSTDHKTYEISFDPSLVANADQLRESSNVSIETNFDGSRYVARTLTINMATQQ